MLDGLEKFSLPEIEEKVLKFWRERDIFRKSLIQRQATPKSFASGQASDKRQEAKVFRFFEGPPTANGKPGIHHVIGRAYKDAVLRYRTMRGYHVPRRAGWDTHGLPVEIAVERELGIKRKAEIEKLGIAEFNAKARASVWQYKAEWERFTERIGFWLDFAHPFVTYENSYIESLWWILSEIHKRGLLKKFQKTVPWCPRCETALSSHELSQPGAYRKVKDPSVYVKFEIRNPKSETRRKVKEYLLVWTTTPWTLAANMAVAVNPKAEYTKYRIGSSLVWSATVPPNPGHEEMEVMEKLSGKKLMGTRYAPPFALRGLPRRPKLHTVLGADFVSLDEGTGLVHVAPAFGEDDARLWEREGGSEAVVSIDDRGVVRRGFPGAGLPIKEADRVIAAELGERGFLHHEGVIEHEYPFCWRCGTALIYMARAAWFVLMSRLRDELIAANQGVQWIPSHLREGRFGEWLREVKDWAISRERYWGTPLPIWGHGAGTPCGHVEVVGSLAELDRRASRGNRFILVRHGEAEHNMSGIFAAGPERPGRGAKLTERGRAQADALARALARAGVGVVVSSPLSRARETARAIARRARCRTRLDARLTEINPGPFNGRPVREYYAYFGSEAERFVKTPPRGETLAQARGRMVAALRDIDRAHRNATIAIVSHGDPLRALEAALAGDGSAEAFQATEPLAVGAHRAVSFRVLPRTGEGLVDLHRPFVDEIVLSCPKCGGELRRVREVADVWFDSGAMPFAQWHYPFAHREMVEPHGSSEAPSFPADYIAEGIDQTRGWFYTLLAVSTLLGRGAPYRAALSYGHVLDREGQKMSKSKGNVVDPWEMVGRHGADALRWYFLAISDPGESRRFDEAELGKIVRRMFLILYHSFAFYAGYAKLHGAASATPDPTHALDRWILIRGELAAAEVARLLDRYEIGRAARLVEELVEDLSHWYIRRSRPRFAAGDPVSLATLGAALRRVSVLLAPLTPLFAEALHQSLARFLPAGALRESVHLEDWPAGEEPGATDLRFLEEMARVRAIASQALAARAAAKVRVRQPLSTLRVKSQAPNSKFQISDELIELLKEEVNVREVSVEAGAEDAIELDTAITPELKREGIFREVTRLIQQLRQDASLRVGEPIALHLHGAEEVLAALRDREAELSRTVGAVDLTIARAAEASPERADARYEGAVGGAPITIALRKR